MKTLYANGCSLTFGRELGGHDYDKNDLITERDPIYREEHAWPKILANSLDMKSFNDAECGSSNDKIFRKTIKWTTQYLANGNDPYNLFVTIAWSKPSRKEYRLDGKWITFLPGTDRSKNEKEKELFNFHNENLLDEYRDSIHTTQYILSLQSWFKVNQISYLFCNALTIFHGKKNRTLNDIISHIDQRRYYNMDNPFYNMNVVCKKFPRGPKLHPLEEGHKHWAKELQNYIEQNGLLQYD